MPQRSAAAVRGLVSPQSTTGTAACFLGRRCGGGRIVTGGRIVAGGSRLSKVFGGGPAAPGAEPLAHALVRQQDLAETPTLQIHIFIFVVLLVLLF